MPTHQRSYWLARTNEQNDRRGGKYWMHHSVDMDFRDISKITMGASLVTYIERFYILRAFSPLVNVSSVLNELFSVRRTTRVLHLPRTSTHLQRRINSWSRKQDSKDEAIFKMLCIVYKKGKIPSPKNRIEFHLFLHTVHTGKVQAAAKLVEGEKSFHGLKVQLKHH